MSGKVEAPDECASGIFQVCEHFPRDEIPNLFYANRRVKGVITKFSIRYSNMALTKLLHNFFDFPSRSMRFS